uniref:HAUS augmin-like complex subunit 3 N-terminal domain-containing protein n=1 Tax=Glossina morsitans morsitans TaxID=37546 RepID=A0A1B0G2E8_GLOMM
MGDIVNNIEIFKKLNFDTSNQWIFYDERFHKFFDFFANNITDSNILTETEILEQEELLRRNQYVETNGKSAECLQKFVSTYPGLLTATEDDIISLRQSVAIMEKLLRGYDDLINDMRIKQYEMDYFLEKARGRGTQGVVDGLDLSKIHAISLSDMERETHELAIVNAHQEMVQKALMIDLENLVHQQAQHIIEMNLYENTKEKLERAQKRHENNSTLSQILSNVLSNAELIWIGIQLDLEKKHNRFDNSEGLKSQSQLCLQRIQLMRNVASNTSDILSVEFITKMIQYLSSCLQHQPRDEVKACLHEYEKFVRLFNYALNGLLSGKHYATILEKLDEINHVETVLHSFVYDGPVDTPMFENVSYLKPIFNANMKKELIDKQLRRMRTQFHENVTERMEKDKLWRYRQLLWMWFLRDPSRVLRVIEEIKRIASKVPQISKTLGGIKRK